MKFTELLLELPLLQGMSRTDINEVVAHTKLGFHKVAQGKEVIAAGDACTQLYMLFKGAIRVHAFSDDRSFTFSEDIKAPDILQPECIFGMTQRYTKTFQAVTECHFIRLEKSEVRRLSTEYEIFRINLLNIICTQSQRSARIAWRIPPEGIRNKIVRFMEVHSIRPIGRKELDIRQEDFARHIEESRKNLSRELNMMEKEGLIELNRGRIIIPALEKLRT